MIGGKTGNEADTTIISVYAVYSVYYAHTINMNNNVQSITTLYIQNIEQCILWLECLDIIDPHFKYYISTGVLISINAIAVCSNKPTQYCSTW